jgi:hypothetical protein
MAESGASTVMLKGIFEQLVEGASIAKKLAQDLLAGMVESVTRHLKQGDRIRIGALERLRFASVSRAQDAIRRLERQCR